MVKSHKDPSDGQDRTILLLVSRCQEGDQDAFGDLVDIFKEKAYGLAYSYLNHRQDAEDVSQEAFIRAFSKINSYDSKLGSFGSWLLKIVANLSLNKLRWKKIRARLTVSLDHTVGDADSDDPMPMQVEDTNADIDPQKSADKSFQDNRMKTVMAALSEQQRTVLQLKFVQGYKISEVAKIMNLAEGTVKSHLFRAVENLKDVMGGGEVE